MSNSFNAKLVDKRGAFVRYYTVRTDPTPRSIHLPVEAPTPADGHARYTGGHREFTLRGYSPQEDGGKFYLYVEK